MSGQLTLDAKPSTICELSERVVRPRGWRILPLKLQFFERPGLAPSSRSSCYPRRAAEQLDNATCT